MPALGRGLAWLPDIAATLLAVVLVLVAVAVLRQEEAPPVPHQRQVPAAPQELVEAFWRALHPDGRAVLVLTSDGGSLQGSVADGEPLVFVLSQDRYGESITALRAAGVSGWREISVPPALGGPEGWNPRFLALAEAGVTRDAFPAALARVLDQDGQGARGSDAAVPARQGFREALRVTGNLVMLLTGLFLLAWLRRARRRR